ncbi:MAG: YlxR family protein [Candidatus Promineifilaceae bacterium]
MKVKQNQHQKHIPQRTCAACRKKVDKRQLTRLVNSAEEGLVVDPSGKRNGRGTYLCSDPACWEKAINTRLLDQALRAEISTAEKQRLIEYQP